MCKLYKNKIKITFVIYCIISELTKPACKHSKKCNFRVHCLLLMYELYKNSNTDIYI